MAVWLVLYSYIEGQVFSYGTKCYNVAFAFVNLVAGLAIGILLRKRLEGNQKNITLQGRQIIENAISEAEQMWPERSSTAGQGRGLFDQTGS